MPAKEDKSDTVLATEEVVSTTKQHGALHL